MNFKRFTLFTDPFSSLYDVYIKNIKHKNSTNEERLLTYVFFFFETNIYNERENI